RPVNPQPSAARCDRCARPGPRMLFQLRTDTGHTIKCARCALGHGPLLKRSLGTAAFVGTVLLTINQGDVLLSARWPVALAWKVPLRYLVPFLVATWGALLNGRVAGEARG